MDLAWTRPRMLAYLARDPFRGEYRGQFQGVEARDVTAGTEFRTKAILGLWRYRRGAAAFIANRTHIPFAQCRDIIEWNWHILIEAYDEGARFQDAGRRILAAGQLIPKVLNIDS